MRQPTLQHFPQVQDFAEGDGLGDIEDENPWTPLQLASSTGDLPKISELLSQGADVDEPPSGWYGKTALQAAALNGHTEAVKKLIAHGAIIDAPGGNNGGRAALTLASGGTTDEHFEIMEVLLAAGANINPKIVRYMGRTPLQAAAETGHSRGVKYLISIGADVNARAAHDTGRTALQGAIERQHEDVIDILLQHGAIADDENMMSKFKGLTALQAAASTGNITRVKQLLERGANVNAKGSQMHGLTALYGAAEGNHHAIIQVLLDAGADKEQTCGNHNWTPLQVARFQGCVEAEKILRST